MTTFQAIVYAIIHGFSDFLPVSANAHHQLVGYLVGWPEPTGPLLGALALGSLAALLVFFRHDWASMISCFLQVLIYRKRPMTLDERMPIFLTLSTLPPLGAWYYLREQLPLVSWTPLLVASILAGAGIALFAADQLGRKNKGMFDWNWVDCLLIGLGQCLFLVPGIGRSLSALSVGLFRNYNREAATKFMLFASAPLVAGAAIIHLRGLDLHGAAPMADVSWLSFYISIAVSFFTGFLVIGGLMRNVQRSGVAQYSVYRVLLGASVFVSFWFRNR